jgi:hypothetical protein
VSEGSSKESFQRVRSRFRFGVSGGTHKRPDGWKTFNAMNGSFSPD